MTDANSTSIETGPPRKECEADLVWHAPVEGVSAKLILVLLLNLGIVILLLVNHMVLLALLVMSALVLLVIFGILSAAHLISAGGITIQRPFGAESKPWSEFAGWRRNGQDIELVYVDTTSEQPLVLHLGQRPDDVVTGIDKYLDELSRGITLADG